MYGDFACMDAYGLPPAVSEPRSWYHIPRSWNYIIVWATTWVQGVEPWLLNLEPPPSSFLLNSL